MNFLLLLLFQSWLVEKLQLLSNVKEEEEIHVCTILVKKIAQIEGKMKVKQVNNQAWYEKVNKVELTKDNIFAKLSAALKPFRNNKSSKSVVVVAGADSGAVNCDISSICNLILSREKCYEEKLNATKRDIEQKERNMAELFSELLVVCSEKKSYLQHCMNYSAFKELNNELVMAMQHNIQQLDRYTRYNLIIGTTLCSD